jgi:SAM-dependent methyltransferase
VLDLGCGTGTLAVDLASAGHAVTGLDPAEAMLDIARRRPGGEDVRWVEGDARRFALDDRFDLALMSGHVFQVFLDRADVAAVLRSVRTHLAPNGRFAFESRNPDARAWDAWTPEATRAQFDVEGVGRVEVEFRVTDERDGLVTFDSVNRFEDGTTLVSPSTLRFLAPAEIATMLEAAGFDAVEWFGDWTGAPFTSASPEIIAIATIR